MDNNNAQIIEGHDHIDDLTGLHNLNGILSRLQGHDDYSASDSSVIIYLNVMNFKSFNQRYGFEGGNVFLKGIAAEIQDIFKGELCARTGGDQFIIHAKSFDEKEIVARLEKLREAAIKYERGLTMRIKAGIYQATGQEQDPVVMVDRAKMACDYIIKVYDKYYNFYDDDLRKRNELRQYVIDNFESAFEKRYFRVYYQKEVRALTGKVCGYEALARWQDPEMGLISPAIFVEVLEDVHLVHKLDTYIIDIVCRDLRENIDGGYVVEPVSVNLSQLDFELCDIKAEVDKCREKYNIPVELLHIEVTESAITSGSEYLGSEIQRFREGGYEVWMDDFGAGYSSFNNLKNYDFDVLKIDMDFLRSFETNKKTRIILSAIVSMAKELGIHTLAEGVETKEQYEFLKRIGCEKLQGYLFGKPKPLDDFDRAVDCSLDVCEDFKFSKYYDSIGDINFLGSTPLREKNLDVFNNVPIAIDEIVDGETPRFLYANNAYLDFLSSLGIASMEEANEKYSLVGIPELREFIDVLDRAEKAQNSRSEADIVTNGYIVNNKARFLAREGNRRAYAIVSRNLSLHKDSDIADSLHVAMTHVFNQYFRVDLYLGDGTVENVFLNGNQLAVADQENDAVKAVKMYADMYLLEQDRERFIKFYDISTVLDRCRSRHEDYLVDYYHSAIPGDNGRMQMYMILPFYYNNGWMYISCCRYADEIADDSLK